MQSHDGSLTSTTLVSAAGHAGDGNIHLSVFQPDDEVRDRVMHGILEAGIALGLIGCQVRNSFDQVKESEAFYTDMSFATSEHFTLRGGLRYTHDKGEQSDSDGDPAEDDGMTCRLHRLV